MAHAPSDDPTPLTPAQLQALAASTVRELSWGLRGVGRELRNWRTLAERIPDRPIRNAALSSLAGKREHSFGAALFMVLPGQRDPFLMRLLVAWQTTQDFVDSVHERHPTHENGRLLMRALLDALDPDRPLSDYYSHNPWQDDGGYLQALVETCRHCCRALPSYDRVRPLVLAEAERLDVLPLNHLPDPAERDRAFRQWAGRHFPDERELAWYELSAAASSTLVFLSLLGLGARTAVSDEQVVATHSAYWPWVALANIMLDAYGDQTEDAASGQNNYVSQYPGTASTVERLERIVAEATRRVRTLPDGHQHAVIVSCMVALYLSKDTARTPALRAGTRRIVDAGGSLTRLLLPVLRIWRIAYTQRPADEGERAVAPGDVQAARS